MTSQSILLIDINESDDIPCHDVHVNHPVGSLLGDASSHHPIITLLAMQYFPLLCYVVLWCCVTVKCRWALLS